MAGRLCPSETRRAIVVVISTLILVCAAVNLLAYELLLQRIPDPAVASERRPRGGSAILRSKATAAMETSPNGTIVDPARAIEMGFRRFDAITSAGRSPPSPSAASFVGSSSIAGTPRPRPRKKKRYSAAECVRSSIACGKACGDVQVASMACWCVRIHGRSVSYLPKSGSDNDGEDITGWDSDLFGSLHHTLNLLQTVVSQQEGDDTFPSSPMYLLVNVYDYPRLFDPEPDPTHPRLATGHPSERATDVRSVHRYNKFKSGFPSCLESCDVRHRWGAPWLGRCYWSLLAHRQPRKCCDVRNHFPIFSWSVNPRYNFDLLVPNRHPGSCSKSFMDQAIASSSTSWDDKERRVVFRGNVGSCEHLWKNPRSSFCAHVEERREELESDLRLTMDVHGKRLTPAEQGTAKFLVLLDGAVAAFRSTWYLSTGSVVLATGLHVDVRTALLRPYVHYIPFKPDLSDFGDALALVADDDAYARWVGDNARRAGRILSQNGDSIDGGHAFDKAYWGNVLERYRDRYEFVEEDEDVRKFTTDRKCEDFQSSRRSRLKRERCIGVEYACENRLQDGFLEDENVKFV